MLDSRRVVGRRGQLLVPLGARVRDHLGVVKGDQVYWHIGRKGDVALTSSPMRPGGRASPHESCPQCAELDKQVRELTGQIHSRRASEGRQYFNQGYMTGSRHAGNPAADLRTLLWMVRQIHGVIFDREPSSAPAADDAPASAPPPSPDSSEGEAATAGPSVPGGP